MTAAIGVVVALAAVAVYVSPGPAGRAARRTVRAYRTLR